VPRALRGETGTDVEYGVRRKDTGETWVATYGYAPLRNAAGKITGTISVGRDVTEQRRGEQRLAQVERLIEAQAALAKSEDQFALVVENITDVIWTMDLDTMRLTYMTPSVERLLGYTPHEALDVELEELLPPDSLERVRATLSSGIESIAHGDTLGLRVTEVDQRRKDGSIVATEVTTRFLPTPDGRLHAVLGITRDITERKRAKEALRQRQRQHETIIRTTLDGFLLTDTSGRMMEVNAAYCAMSGYSEQELLTMSVQDLEEMGAEEIASRMGRSCRGRRTASSPGIAARTGASSIARSASATNPRKAAGSLVLYATSPRRSRLRPRCATARRCSRNRSASPESGTTSSTCGRARGPRLPCLTISSALMTTSCETLRTGSRSSIPTTVKR
jgi:PAS domain S-box-containing protein